mmetsp:Transcript_81852/g.213051  ORF Transcript_81852/g.213051 Transcript_81852/m.213051 type:complete len:273 (+) Transcript_81852:916-1734(+)
MQALVTALRSPLHLLHLDRGVCPRPSGGLPFGRRDGRSPQVGSPDRAILVFVGGHGWWHDASHQVDQVQQGLLRLQPSDVGGLRRDLHFGLRRAGAPWHCKDDGVDAPDLRDHSALVLHRPPLLDVQGLEKVCERKCRLRAHESGAAVGDHLHGVDCLAECQRRHLGGHDVLVRGQIHVQLGRVPAGLLAADRPGRGLHMARGRHLHLQVDQRWHACPVLFLLPRPLPHHRCSARCLRVHDLGAPDRLHHFLRGADALDAALPLALAPILQR